MQTLQDVFRTYAGFGTRQVSTELDGAKFVKVFKDAGLVGKDLSTTELDIIFSKVSHADHTSRAASPRMCGSADGPFS